MEIITTLKDIVIAIAAAVGAWIAYQGLNTWNRQLKGSAEYELARRLLKCTYKLRDALKGVRHPAMWAAEMPSPPAEDAKSMKWDERHYYGLSRAYEMRWQKVADIRTELQAEALEAETLWGQDVHQQFKQLYDLQVELLMAVRNYLSVSDPSELPETKKALQEIRRKQRNILYDHLTDEDEFTRDINSAISSIETYLKPHLRQ